MNFSKYRLQKYLKEGQAVSTGAQGSLDTSNNSSIAASNGGRGAREQQSGNKVRQQRQETQVADTPPKSGIRYEEMQKELESVKSYESQKSDWRTELQEKVVDGQERQQHPFVTVMPTGDENLIQAVEQMVKTAKKKKESVEEQMTGHGSRLDTRYHYDMEDNDVKTGDIKNRKIKVKGKKKKFKTEDVDVTLEGYKPDPVEKRQKKVADLKKREEIASAQKGTKYETSKTEDPDKLYRRQKAVEFKTKLRKEEVEALEEEKKKCKKGYEKKDGKCVKKKKSSSKKTTIVVGRGMRPIFGLGLNHHHHDDDHDQDNDGGGNGGGGAGEAGGMGEMFDLLGDMLLQEKMEKSERMKKMEAEYAAAAKQPSPFDKMTDKQKKQMSKATKSTRNYK